MLASTTVLTGTAADFPRSLVKLTSSCPYKTAQTEPQTTV